jgi:hypothetical protein
VFWSWAEHVMDVGELRGELRTIYGWPLRVTPDTRSTTLWNFPMQGNGAEMLRLACCLATERGIQVCAPVHDALLIEAGADELREAVDATRVAMAAAGRAVLAGVEVATEAVTIAWPERYSDPRGQVMWERVTPLLDQATERYGDSPEDWPDVQAPTPLRQRKRKGSGQRRGLTGMARCSGCGKWIRKRPALDDWAAAERAYAGDEWQEHYCEADFGRALDLASAEERAAWEAIEAHPGLAALSDRTGDARGARPGASDPGPLGG